MHARARRSARAYALALAASLALLAAQLVRDSGAPDLPAVLLLAVSCALAGFVAGGLLTRRKLERLHAGILRAQDGTFDPVEPPALDHPELARLYEEYNRTMAVLGGMFAFVEDCQRRFLNEHDKLNVVVQGLPLALLGVDDNVHVNIANRQAEMLFGMTGSQLIGSSLFEILDLNDTERDALRDAFLYKHAVRNRVINITAGGAERCLTVNLSFITEREADMAAIITLLDITDYKRLQESAYNREKLVAMGQLAAGVAHELNTPLGNMSGYAQLLVDSAKDPARLANYASIIKEEAHRCSRIIHNLLNFARKEHCYGDRCEVNALIRDIVDAFISCRLRQSEITVKCEFDPDDPVAEGGCGELEIVLTNLLINAIQALEGVEQPQIVVRSGADGTSMVWISVEDNGPGIPPEARNRVFDPFFTTKDVGDGSGLGLSISLAMLARRGGTIRLDNGFEKGARFVVRCPTNRKSVPAHADGE